MEEKSTPKKEGLLKPIDSSPKGNTSKSKLDALTGNHTTSVLVSILFLVTLVCCFFNPYFITVLVLFARYFIVSAKNKKA